MNSNIPEKRYRIFRSKEDLEELPADSTEIFQRNMLDRYIDRPDRTFQKGKYAEVDSMCFAEFLAYYSVQSKAKQESRNDSQPVVLDDELMESHLEMPINKTIPLMSSDEKMQRRKVRAVLRYHVPNANRNVEGCAHHLLFSPLKMARARGIRFS